MTQALKELLTEQGIALEPDKPPGKTVSNLIQRGWSLLFGRKGSYLYPAHVERLGGLMVMPFEGLVHADFDAKYTLDSTTVVYECNFGSAAPRISIVRASQNLAASPYTLCCGPQLEIYDGQESSGELIACLPGGAHECWVFTEAAYISFGWNVAIAAQNRVSLRSWNL